jgi:hypothetical protein
MDRGMLSLSFPAYKKNCGVVLGLNDVAFLPECGAVGFSDGVCGRGLSSHGKMWVGARSL